MAVTKYNINAISKVLDSSPEGMLIAEYFKRMQGKLSINHYDVKEKFPPDKQKIYEAEILLKNIKNEHYVIALEEKGKQFDSVEFAKFIENINQPIFYLIGGAYGLSDEVRNRANLVMSLGKLTMPHMLARVVLVEQIYRSCTINSNHPYHK